MAASPILLPKQSLFVSDCDKNYETQVRRHDLNLICPSVVAGATTTTSTTTTTTTTTTAVPTTKSTAKTTTTMAPANPGKDG